MRGESDFSFKLRGFRLTTAEILYHMPDHPGLLQTFIWQTLDLPPQYPRLSAFLDHWRKEIDAVIHSIAVATDGTVAPPQWRKVDHVLQIQ